MLEVADVFWYGTWLGVGLWLLVEEYRRHPSLDELTRRAREPVS
jgi:hypothetical protein